MQKERVRSSKLRKLRNFEILIRNLRKKSGLKEMLITQSILNILNSTFLYNSSALCPFINPLRKPSFSVTGSMLAGLPSIITGTTPCFPNISCLGLNPRLVICMFLELTASFGYSSICLSIMISQV